MRTQTERCFLERLKYAIEDLQRAREQVLENGLSKTTRMTASFGERWVVIAREAVRESDGVYDSDKVTIHDASELSLVAWGYKEKPVPEPVYVDDKPAPKLEVTIGPATVENHEDDIVLQPLPKLAPKGWVTADGLVDESDLTLDD